MRVFERAYAGGHFVQQLAQGVNVGARIQLLSQQLLGRHVRERAGRGVQMTIGAVGFSHGFEQLGQSEVADLRAAVGGDQNIAWLQVAVKDSLLVCRRKSFRNLQPEVSDLLLRKSH